MRRLIVVLLAGLLLPIAPSSATIALGNEVVARGPGKAQYDVQLTSDATGRSWTGRQRIAFTNTTRKPLAEIYLRLWGNAWDGCKAPVKLSRFEGGAPGAPTVNCTAVKVTLTKKLAPGKQSAVAFDLVMTAPARLERFGQAGAHNFFGNALPVLAVHDQAGWHLEPDLALGESYYTLAADFAVRLRHPAAVQVPATGVTSTASQGKLVTTTSIAKQVRDFAFAAGPFKHSVVTSPGGVKVRTWWTGTVTAAAVADARTKGVAALDDFSRRFGQYPYGEVDLVLNDKWVSFSGMEYPGYVLLIAPPSEEGPVVHELAHQWWYGIVGNNEYADPWLDEAFATYASYLHWGDAQPGCWPGKLDARITNDTGFWKKYGAGWSQYVYTYGACMLSDLQRYIGTPAMEKLMKSYAKSHWYGVSTPGDFKSAAKAATTKDLAPFWTSHQMY